MNEITNTHVKLTVEFFTQRKPILVEPPCGDRRESDYGTKCQCIISLTPHMHIYSVGLALVPGLSHFTRVLYVKCKREFLVTFAFHVY